MKIITSKAVKLFFSNPSLEMVYFEAVANSIDAGATEIGIHIEIASFSEPESLKISIKDNGVGFNDRNFSKFSNLLDLEEEGHKGVGRLVYLNYFKKVDITSIYGENKRLFTFRDEFDGESEIKNIDRETNDTVLKFAGYTKDKIKSYDYLKPSSIKKALLLKFFPLFYSLKKKKKELTINIQLKTKEQNTDYGFLNETVKLLVSKIPKLKSERFPAEQLDLFEEFELFYSVKQTFEDTSPITALCIDGRANPVDILSNGGIPQGYEVVFLLYSNYFTGKTNSSRQELTLTDIELKTIKKIFRDKASIIINREIPSIQNRNLETNLSLEKRYPHLQGYFEEKSVGLIDRNESLDSAQEKFFKAQKEILEANDLSDKQYQKSLEISSRILTEYILYRNIIIKKLSTINRENSEADIHNIIVPMRKTFKKDNKINDIYSNNAWLLDDKYMSYSTILSDEDMDKLIKEITIEGGDIKKDDTRPDISFVFSGNPTDINSKLDVVIVELKKLGLPLEEKEKIISQLRKRARKLLNYYPDRIQRIWFYGIIDFDEDFITSLTEEKYVRIYSNDNFFYKEVDIIPDQKNRDYRIPIGVNLLSFDAFIKDAKDRNSTFLDLLKEGLKRKE